MKKFLYITHLSGKRVNRIWLSAFRAAEELGYEVHLACNMAEAEHPGWERDCAELGIQTHQIDFIRSPFDPRNRKAAAQLTELMKREGFSLVHCNTPVGGMLGRICAEKSRVPGVIYQAHGFHFWKGAPLQNWLFFYPVEKWLSRKTGTLVTITLDDFELAKKMNARRTAYVHGIGINLAQFARRDRDDRNPLLRRELGIPENARVLLSVGELNANKNHRAVLEALAAMNREDIHYVICGEGDQRAAYEKYIRENGLEGRIHLMGFQHDIAAYDRMADVFIFPSFREGIPGAVMEAVATGVPVLASDIRGVRDIIRNDRYRFDPRSPEEIAGKITRAFEENHDQAAEDNIRTIMPYSFDAVVKELTGIYRTEASSGNGGGNSST